LVTPDVSPAPPFQLLDVGQILLAQCDASLVARLVLGADQGVGRAASLSARVDIGACATDRFLYMPATTLGSPERPNLAPCISKKPAELGAVFALAADAVWPNPVCRRFQRLGDARLEMGDRGSV
jgi:hypothetical protein